MVMVRLAESEEPGAVVVVRLPRERETGKSPGYSSRVATPGPYSSTDREGLERCPT